MDSDSFGLLLSLSADLITLLVDGLEDTMEVHQQRWTNAWY